MLRAAKKSRLVFNAKAGIRLCLFAVFVVMLAIILPKSYRSEYTYDVGKPWMGPDLQAAFDFPIYKSVEEIEAEKAKLASEVVAVFLPDSMARQKSLSALSENWSDFSSQVLEYKKLESSGDEHAQGRLNILLEQFPFDEGFVPLVVQASENFPEIQERFKAFVELVIQTGYMSTPPGAIPREFISVRINPFEEKRFDKLSFFHALTLQDAYVSLNPLSGPAEVQIARMVLFPSLFPTLILNEELTGRERKMASQKASPVKDLIEEGHILIRKGEIVSPQAETLLQSYSMAKDERYGERNYWTYFLGYIGMVGMIVLMLALFLRSNRPRIFYRNRKVGFILTVMFLMMVIAQLILMFSLRTGKIFDVNFSYLVPACMVPLIITAFFDLRVGFFVNILMSILIGALISNGFEYFFVQFCAGTVSVYAVTRLRNRGDFFFSLSYIFATYVFSYCVYSLFSGGSFSSIDYSNFALFGLNVLLTFITYPLIWVFEKTFRMTSELTYVELLDTNHPLLKELFNRAPGTFHHSLQVANISEAVVRRIGGNSLLTKVGALFHDVGKMENPRYFVENQADHLNPHDKIDFEKSTQIIIKHVQDGIKLAQQHNLPREVMDFIRTHHGTSRVEFFFRRYSAEHKDEKVDEKQFRYPGPLPFTRETAVVMIVDSIEAACRAMTSRSREDMRNLIEKIIEYKISLRQLDHANITFKDLQDIKTVVLEQLTNIYHERIAYPE